MKSLVFFALVAVCAARPQGFIADTPEVIAEKQRFIQLYNAAAAAAAAAPDIDIHFTPVGGSHRFTPQTNIAPQPQWSSQTQWTPQSQWNPANAYTETTFKYTGPLASTIPAGVDGTVTPVRNTAEVEAAIAEFTRAYNAAVVSTTGGIQNPAFVQQPQHFRAAVPQTTFQYQGPFASDIPAGLPGSPSQVADTADVQAAKAAFDRAYQQQLAYTQVAPQYNPYG